MLCKNIGTKDKFCRKVALLRYKLEFSFKTKNLTEEWALCCHPRDNVHVTH